jgi:hypothetical protein
MSAVTAARTRSPARRKPSPARPDPWPELLRYADSVLAGAAASAERLEADRWARRYLESRRPAHLLAQAPPPSAAEQGRISEAQADTIVAVIRKVLEGLGIKNGQYRAGIKIAIEVLQAASNSDWEPL